MSVVKPLVMSKNPRYFSWRDPRLTLRVLCPNCDIARDLVRVRGGRAVEPHYLEELGGARCAGSRRRVVIDWHQGQWAAWEQSAAAEAGGRRGTGRVLPKVTAPLPPATCQAYGHAMGEARRVRSEALTARRALAARAALANRPR